MKSKTEDESKTNRDEEKATMVELARFLDQKKGEDIRLLDLREANSYLSFFVIVSVLSGLHLKNLANETIRFLRNKKIKLIYPDKPEFDSGWITLDFGSFIVHLFTPEKRDYYNLESLWNSAIEIPLNEISDSADE